MAWGAAQEIGQTDTAVANSWTQLDNATSIALNPRELMYVQLGVYANQSGAVANAAEIRVLSSYDGTTFDDTPVFAMSFEPSTGQTEEFVSFVISGYPYLRIEVKSAGGTTTYNFSQSIGSHYKLDGVSA